MREKLSIRLPGDDDYGPNPYDSRTTPADLPKNAWLSNWGWWGSIIMMGGGITLVRLAQEHGWF